MRMTLSTMALAAALTVPADAVAQPAIVTTGPADAGSREVGFGYSAWAMDDEHSGSAAAARYTYNVSSEVAIESLLDVGSARSRPFAVGTVQVRLMQPPRPFESSKFITFGFARSTAPRGSAAAPRGWARSFGLGMQQPVTGDHAIRIEGQLLIFEGEWSEDRKAHGGIRLALSLVWGRD